MFVLVLNRRSWKMDCHLLAFCDLALGLGKRIILTSMYYKCDGDLCLSVSVA